MTSENPRIPYDVLNAITAAYVKLQGTMIKYDRSGSRVVSYKYLWPLSLVCKDLNDICGRYIFDDYRLTLRANQRHICPPKLTERDAQVGFDVWDEEAVRERIKHFADRARCVRSLTISTYGDKETESFPEVIVPLLVEAIASATQLKSITFKCGGIALPLPKPIWEALCERNLGEVDIEGLLPPLDAPSPMPTVRRLYLEWCGSVAGYMELFDPEQIILSYGSHYGRRLIPFQPTSATLRYISAQYDMHYLPSVDKPIFDFSMVPRAAIKITIVHPCELKMHIPANWRKLKGYVRHAFSEGLDGYDVRRLEHFTAEISRPALVGPGSVPNFEPRHRVHLEGHEKDRREQERMDNYYRMKREQQFRRFFRN